MRHFYFCSILAFLFSYNSFGQLSKSRADSLFAGTKCYFPEYRVEKIDTTKIRLGCRTTFISEKPLYVIDGIVSEETDLKNIDPNNIESIDILKEATSIALFCHRNTRGVIIITTKIKGTITIKDAVSGEAISGASVDLVYSELGRHKIRLLSDSFGRVTVNKIITGAKYDIRVSNIGYKTYSTSLNDETVKAGYSVSMQRNYADLKEVVVTSWRHIRCRCLNCNVTRVIACGQSAVKIVSADTNVDTQVTKEIKLYPNPVSRSHQVNIEFENEKTEKISLRLFSLDGKLVGTKEYEVIKAMNKISYSVSSQLSAGAYAIQLMNGNGKIIKTEKLIIQ